MAATIAHRGPDSTGVWVDPSLGLALGHQRLAIQDLSSAGHQPMHSASGRYVIAFNGEIYNHLELRRSLTQDSLIQQPWRGLSDTETLLAAIENWGLEAALQRCAGMFAFALWDRKDRKLIMARDRFGEKPLYWGWLVRAGERVLAFASELSAIRACPDTASPAVNHHSLASFFRFGCLSAPESIYDGFYQLRPGHFVEFNDPIRHSNPKPWWDLQLEASTAFTKQPLQALHSEEILLEQLNSTLQMVINQQSLADVPLGSFLSGGIDSSLITALLQAGSTQPVRSFTIAFPDTGAGECGFNEAPYAKAVADYLGTDHLEVPLTSSDARALIPQIPLLYTEPFADSSQLPTHLVCREARRSGLTVALSGDGADELFAGYNRYRLAPQLHSRVGGMPSLLRRGIGRILEKFPVSREGLARDKRRKLAAAIRSSGSLADLQLSLTGIWTDPDSLLFSSFSPISAPIALPNAPTGTEQLMLADMHAYLPSDILVKVDRAAMAASLETRAPFLDHRIASLAWQLPMSFKLRDGVGKWALRQLLERYVPKPLIERPKAGFAVPIGPWLRGPLRSWADELLDPALIRSQGWLHPDPVQRLWRAHLEGHDYTPQLWTVLMWQAWCAHWTS